MIDLRYQYRKWRFEKKYGKHSYGAALFLAAVDRMQQDRPAPPEQEPVAPEPDDEGGIAC